MMCQSPGGWCLSGSGKREGNIERASCLCDHSMAVAGSREGIGAPVWHPQSQFFPISTPIIHVVLCFALHVSLKWLHWTSWNKRRQFLLDFDSLLKHPDASSWRCQNFSLACWSVCLLAGLGSGFRLFGSSNLWLVGV